MSTPREFTMNYNFKLVYTDIVYNVEISSHETLHDLFDKACIKFAPHIDYNMYYIDYVIAGQDKGELASSVGHLNLYDPIWYEFGSRWRQVSFYVRPVSRTTNTFVRMDRYIQTTSDTQVPETEVPDTQVPETDIQVSDALGVILPPPPGLIRQ